MLSVRAELVGSCKLFYLFIELLDLGETIGDVVYPFCCLCNSYRNLEEPKDIELCFLCEDLDPFFIYFISD